MRRRELLALGVCTAGVVVAGPRRANALGEHAMYGLIGKLTALEGRRDELARILLEGVGAMPGCLSYVVATDPQAPDALWITEVWDSQDSHRASLALPAVRDAIARGRPLIASFDQHTVTTVLGGHGLDAA